VKDEYRASTERGRRGRGGTRTRGIQAKEVKLKQVRVSYSDVKGETLYRRSVWVPGGETRAKEEVELT